VAEGTIHLISGQTIGPTEFEIESYGVQFTGKDGTGQSAAQIVPWSMIKTVLVGRTAIALYRIQ
jgi:hypothetical protein